MLVLTRHSDERIMIGDDVEITIVEIKGDKVRIGISAPSHVPVHRREVYLAIKAENVAAAEAAAPDLDQVAAALGAALRSQADKPGVSLGRDEKRVQ